MISYRNKVTYLSFSLSLLVMVRHAINIGVYGLTSGPLYWLEAFLYDFSDIAVPLFFMLSGYLFFQNYDPSKRLQKWKSRVFSILIPYLLWNLIGFLYISALHQIPFVRNSMSTPVDPFTIGNILKNTLLDNYNITWFLKNILLYSFLFPLLWPLLKTRWGCPVLFVAAFIVGWITEDCYGYAYNAVFYLPGVYMGIHHREAFRKRFSGTARTIAAALLVLTTLASILVPFVNIATRLPFRLVQAALLWAAADILAVEKAPAWWMQLSFIIYCSHSLILESVQKVFLLLLGRSTFAAAMDFFFAPLITLGIILFCSRVCKKMPPLWKLLSGNR